MNEILKALGPVQRRLRLRRLLQGAGGGFACGSLAALILLAVTSFVPLQDRWWIAAAAVTGCTLLGAAGNALRTVDPLESARAADACGLRERSVTALEMAEVPETEMTRFQRQDACEHLRNLDVKQIPLRFPKRLAAAGAALLVLCAGTLLIPGGGDRVAAERKALQEKTADMIRTVDEAEKADEDGLTEKEKADLRKLTEELKRELNASREDLDVMVALDKAEQQLEKLRSEQMQEKTAGDVMSAAEAMNALAQAMQNAGMSEETAAALSEAMASGDAAAMSAALSGLDADQMKELAEGLTGQAQSMAEQLAEAAEQGNMSDAQMQALQAGMQANAQQASALQQALSGMKAGFSGTGQQSGEQTGQSGTGQGGSNPQGPPGGGAGTGSTNEEQKGGGGGQQSGTNKGNRPPEFKEGEYETIYDPEKADTSSRDVMTEQNSQGKDSVQIETGPGKGTLEGNVPFRQVVGEYAEQEALAAESAHLTKEQKEWVDEYFRQLTGE
uniref:Hypothetical membrane-associated protein n=1 Tax=uncultured microorganism TaxID=358574 RepID=I3PGA7_9ZZZZ|nr:hypothetical membrane-associated protein [uncultured microorganism]